MGALIAIEDIEEALGREAANSREEAEWQFYINTISDFINSYVDVSFEPVTETVRMRANSRGEIKLKTPVNDLTSITNFRTGEEDLYADWDGMDLIYYLEPNQVVDVSYSHGFNTVPEDIKNLIVSAILAQIDEYSPVTLRSYMVGDVAEEYRGTFVQQIFGEGAIHTLNKYCLRSFTIETGGAGDFPDYVGGQEYLNDF